MKIFSIKWWMWWCCGESAFRRHRTEYQGDGSAGFTGGLGLIWYRKWRGLFRWSQYRFGDPYLEIAFNPGLPTPTFVSLLKADSSQMRIPLQSISLEEMSQADVVKAKEAESVDCLLKSLLRDREDLRLIEGYLDKLQQHGEMFPLPMTPQDVLDCGETHGTAKGLFEAKCQIQKKLVSA